MNDSLENVALTLRVLRWSARILSVLSVGVVLLFVFGEG